MANKSVHGLFSPLEVVSTNNLLKIQQDQCKIRMSRIYYSSIFKIYYLSLIVLCGICIFLTLFDFYQNTSILFLLEVLASALLVSECIYRGFMQGWNIYIKRVSNAVDLIITVVSIVMIWIGYQIGGGIGEIDEVTAIVILIVRCGIQLIRLVRALKRRKDQEIQIIDLNGISEGEEMPQHTEKNLRAPRPSDKQRKVGNKKHYEESVDESR